ncbi:MAG TPA: glycosyltransferase, partial [Fimbriimonas sp.]|nr:glycosyltransferase [Fimbriimonas sp.]
MDIIVGAYCFFIVAAILNLWLMPRPRRDGEPTFEVMIPARTEAPHIGPLVAGLVSQGLKVTVFDDESTDGTGEIAAEAGAVVVTPAEPLPAGWKGKPRACNELAKHATSDWVMFLDADTFPAQDFGSKIAGLIEGQPADVGALTGIPVMRTGAGIEPIYLGWVPWILTVTNHYGLTYALGRGHTKFTNGQIVVWRRSVLEE